MAKKFLPSILGQRRCGVGVMQFIGQQDAGFLNSKIVRQDEVRT